jgi:hypothetical protein
LAEKRQLGVVAALSLDGVVGQDAFNPAADLVEFGDDALVVGQQYRAGLDVFDLALGESDVGRVEKVAVVEEDTVDVAAGDRLEVDVVADAAEGWQTAGV